MTLDEAKQALTVHGQEAFRDLFQPCTCGGAGPVYIQVVTELPVKPRPLSDMLKEPCRACKALQVVSAAVAVAGTHAKESPLFTKLVEQYYPS